jgi:hypothetical protein
MGSAGASGIVILDFGQPWVQNGTYGSILFSNLTFAATSDIATAAENYLDGFYNCSASTSQILHLAVGTTNFSGDVKQHCPPLTDDHYVTNAHGVAWGQLVNTLAAYIASHGYSAQEYARGADDIEPCWSSPTEAKAWIDGYSSATNLPMYDFGSADGCPGACPNGWTPYDLWYVSYGNADAYPLPEIYYHSMAHEWYAESAYAEQSAGGPILFLGTMTEYASDSSTYAPADGFTALQSAINADSSTAYPLQYSTDITWAN